MRVLALKSSFVLVGWINILAELTQNGRVFTDVEANNDIVHFLASALKECSEEEGVASTANVDPVVARIDRIKREQLNCLIPFDSQTMDHVGALVGAYLDLSMENYKRSLHETSQMTTPFAFFVMTTKRLLHDVNVLKRDKGEKGGHSKKRNRESHRARDVNDDIEEEGGDPNDDKTRRQSSVSTRLSYSSASSPSAESRSSSAESSFSSAFASDPDATTSTALSTCKERSEAIRKNEKKPLGGLFSAGRGIDGPPIGTEERGESEPWPAYWPEDKEPSFHRMKTDLEISEDDKDDGEADRRLSHLEKDQSPINTSHKSSFTPANTESSHLTDTTGGSSSSANADTAS